MAPLGGPFCFYPKLAPLRRGSFFAACWSFRWTVLQGGLSRCAWLPFFFAAGMLKMPEPLMSCDKAFHVAPPVPVGGQGAACQHHFKHMQKLFPHFQVALVAGVMKGNQNFVR